MSHILYRFNDLKRLQQGQMISPSFVDLHLSDVCNQCCKGCAFKDGHENDYMKEGQFFRAADILLGAGVKAFAFCGGGEPAVCPYLPEAWEYLARRGAGFSMLTNGSLLTEQMIHTMILRGTFIRVSLEASDVDSYARYKQVPLDMWHTVLGNVMQLVEWRNKLSSPCSVGIKFAVSKTLRGYDHYLAGVELANELGVDRLTFKAIRGTEESLSPEESLAEDRMLTEALSIMSPKCRISRWIMPVRDDYVPQCWLNPVHTVMNWRGDLFICCYYYFRREAHKLGNIFDDDFKALWYGRQHYDKVKAIDRHLCSTVDCKFFHYHDDFNEADRAGAIHQI